MEECHCCCESNLQFRLCTFLITHYTSELVRHRATFSNDQSRACLYVMNFISFHLRKTVLRFTDVDIIRPTKLKSRRVIVRLLHGSESN